MTEQEAITKLHKTLDDLALYVLRYGKDPTECFEAVALLQETANAFRLPITATFSSEYWPEQRAAAERAKR